MAVNVPSPHSQLWRWEVERLLSGSTGGGGGISGTVIASDSPPTSPSLNQLWWETNTGALYIWYNDGDSSQWVMVTAAAIIGDMNMQGFKILNTTGVNFPATPVLSADPNTLDDYEEGTWTPRFQGSTTAGTMTYSIQQGFYTKIGSTVMVTVNLLVNTITAAPAGSMSVTGLPFPLSSSQNWAAGNIGFHGFTLTGATNYGIMLDAGFPIAATTQLRLNYGVSGGALSGSVPASAIPNGCYLMASATYKTDV